MTDGDIRIGFEYLPTQIKNHLQQTINSRPDIPHVYHTTEIIGCLRKAYFKRMLPELNKFEVESTYHIFRGSFYDSSFTPLFKVNQKTFVLVKDGAVLVGTLDFVCFDEKKERALYDLKSPKNCFYKKKYGAGKHYRRQVQSYLAMAHDLGELLDINKLYVLMCADIIVREEVAPDSSILGWLWDRIFMLEYAFENDDPSLLVGPESSWECGEKFCPYRELCRKIFVE